jgi:WD40 repeat protein
LRAWRSLRAWIDDDRARLAALDRLEGWVREWRRSPDALLTGSRLGHATELAERHPDDVGDDARALIVESRAAVERETQRLRDALTRAKDLSLVASARAASDDPTTQVILLRGVERPEETPRWAELALEALTKPIAERGFDLHPHGGAVEFAAFSPDATRLLTRSEDERVRLWRTDVAGEPVTLSHTGDYEAWAEADRPRYNGFAALTCASFSPDGARVVTGWADGTATVWSTAGERLRELRGQHERALTDVALSPDGTRVVTASVDGTARVWAVDFDDEPVALRGHTGRVERAAFSPDGNLVVTASGDGTARVWSAVEAGEPRVLRGHRDRVTDAAWSPDGARIITASMDGVLGLWRLDDPSAPAAWNDLETPLRAVSFLPDGRRAVAFPHNSFPRKGPVDGSGPFVLSFNPVEPLAEVTSSRSGACVAITLAGYARLHDPRGEFAPVTLGVHRVLRAAFTADGARVLTVTRDGALRVWPADGRGVLRTWRARGERVLDAAPWGDGLLVVTQRDPEHESDDPDMCLRVWRPRRSAPLVLQPCYGSISTASLSRDGEQLVACTGREALLWRLASPHAPVALRGHEDHLETAAFSADGRHVLTASRDATARLWSATTGCEVARRLHKSELFAAALSGNGAHAVTGEFNAARLWATDRPAQTITSYTPQFDVRHVALSDDGLRGASAALRAVHVWRVEPPATEVVLPHADRVGPIAFSPDGTLLVTASDDGAARVWELPAGRERVALRGHEDGVAKVRFSDDGAQVVTVSRGGVARLWPVTIPGILARLRAATACALTAAQRAELLGEP